jgi:hypothetical protein
MIPGRIYYNVDIPEKQMRQVLPYLDFETDLIVVGGYGDDVEVVDCRRCGAQFDPMFPWKLELVEDFHRIERFRCPVCFAPTDTQFYYVGCEELVEACDHVFNHGEYPAYQIWPKDGAYRQDVAYVNWPIADIIVGTPRNRPDGPLKFSFEWLYRDIKNFEGEFKTKRDALFAPFLKDPTFVDALDGYAYNLKDLKVLIRRAKEEEARDNG